MSSNLDLQGYDSLGADFNKAKGNGTPTDTDQGVVSEKLDELELDMSNDKIVLLTRKWTKAWDESEVKTTWTEQGKGNEKYWKGKHYDLPSSTSSRPMVDNVIFESLETYLPQVTRRNPDPMVSIDKSEEETPENMQFAKSMQGLLGEIADEDVLRLKLKKAARHWAIYLLGAAKVTWDTVEERPAVSIIRPGKLILDPTATVDENGYSGEYIGEHRTMTAEALLEAMEKIGAEEDGKKAVKALIKKDNGGHAYGTDIGFIEWWTPEYMCWTLKDHTVLAKTKDPNWDYGTEEEEDYDEFGNAPLDEEGNVMMKQVEGINHFKKHRIPYVLLSVFNLGKGPVDETSLIGQNLSNQDLVNKRNRQIDKNADSMNGGMAVSGERSGLTKDQAKGVTDAIRNGGVVYVPKGNVNEAVARLSAPGLPPDIYNQLQDTRNRIRDIFGTRGSSAAGTSQDRTVRGKLQSRVLDTDRIGGGFSEYLEQMADQIYNWFVQLLYVYDDRYAGKPNLKVIISVKEGSLLPKDSTAMANQAIELAGAGKMSTVDLYKALDYPDPARMAANAWLETNAPEILFKDDVRVQQVLESRQQAAQPQDKPNISMNYKDLPPEGQAQAAQQAGLNLDPTAIAAYEKNKGAMEAQKEIAVDAAKTRIKNVSQSISQ